MVLDARSPPSCSWGEWGGGTLEEVQKGPSLAYFCPEGSVRGGISRVRAWCTSLGKGGEYVAFFSCVANSNRQLWGLWRPFFL